MIRLYDFDEVKPEEILNRDIRAEADVEATVDAIIADVRARGDAALLDYAAKFDHAQLTSVQVTQAEIDEAFSELEASDPRIHYHTENGRFQHPPLPRTAAAQELCAERPPRHGAGPEVHPHPARGCLRARRHGSLPLYRADGRSPPPRSRACSRSS